MALGKEYLPIKSDRKNNGTEPLALVRGGEGTGGWRNPGVQAAILFLSGKRLEAMCDKDSRAQVTWSKPPQAHLCQFTQLTKVERVKKPNNSQLLNFRELHHHPPIILNYSTSSTGLGKPFISGSTCQRSSLYLSIFSMKDSCFDNVCLRGIFPKLC